MIIPTYKNYNKLMQFYTKHNIWPRVENYEGVFSTYMYHDKLKFGLEF